ncbi:MAG: hypothetical protein JSV80_18155 [Acidobacteriota bacterium]|nr:MAG: hypothetical protein JSV80_18155 [Acidobacteriota bacterium]
MLADVERLEPRLEETEGELGQILRRRAGSKMLELLEAVHELAEKVAEREARNEDAAEDRGRAAAYVSVMSEMIQTHALEASGEVTALAKDPAFLSGDERDRLERRLVVAARRMIRVHRAALDNLEHMDLLDLPADETRRRQAIGLQDRAENLSAHMELAVEEAELLHAQLQDEPENAELQSQERAA